LSRSSICPSLSILYIWKLGFSSKVFPLKVSWVTWWSCEPMAPKSHQCTYWRYDHFYKEAKIISGIVTMAEEISVECIWKQDNEQYIKEISHWWMYKYATATTLPFLLYWLVRSKRCLSINLFHYIYLLILL